MFWCVNKNLIKDIHDLESVRVIADSVQPKIWLPKRGSSLKCDASSIVEQNVVCVCNEHNVYVSSIDTLEAKSHPKQSKFSKECVSLLFNSVSMSMSMFVVFFIFFLVSCGMQCDL